MFTRNCPQCNSIIDYNHPHTKNKAERNNTRCAYCRNQRNLKPNCECKVCKKALYRRPSRLNQDNIFCSYGCRNRYFSGDRGKHKPKPKRNRSWDQQSQCLKLQPKLKPMFETSSAFSLLVYRQHCFLLKVQ